MEEKRRERRTIEKKLEDKLFFKVIDFIMNSLPVIGIVVATAAEFGVSKLKNNIILYTAIVIGFAALLSSMTILVRLLRRRSRSATALKKQLVQVFSDALEKSHINPGGGIQYE